MSFEMNPYQSPEAQTAPVSETGGGPSLTAAMLTNLKAASPWLRFLGIIGYIGSGFLALLGILIMAGTGTAAAAAVLEESGAFMQGFTSSLGALGGILYLGLAVLSFFPARFTYNFGAKLRNYFWTANIEELEAAFKNNKLLWTFNGVLTVISLALVPALIIIGTVIAAVTLSI